MTLTRKFITTGNPADGTTATASNAGVESITANSGSSLTWVTDAQFPGTVLQSSGGAGVTTLVRDAFDSGILNNTVAWGFPMKTPAAVGGQATVFTGRVGTALSGTVITGGARGFSWQYGTSGVLSLYDSANTITTIAAAGKLAPDTWYYFTVRAVGGSTTAGAIRIKVYAITDTTLSTPLSLVNSTDAVHPTTTEYYITTANLTVNPFVANDLASMGVTGTLRYANFQYDDGGTTEIPPYSPANSVPVVNAGSDQSVAAGSTVNLAATASDADGNPLTYSWSFLYSSTSTAPTLSGGSTATPTFTASATEGQLYILQVQVSDGTATATDTVEIQVPTGGAFSVLPGAGSNGAWSNIGAAASEGAALIDSVDSTLVRSPAYTGTESEARWRLQPLRARTSLQFDIRSLVSATGGTVKFRLYEGNVLKQEWTVTQSTSAANQTLVISGPNLPSSGGWGNLYVAAAVIV